MDIGVEETFCATSTTELMDVSGLQNEETVEELLQWLYSTWTAGLTAGKASTEKVSDMLALPEFSWWGAREKTAVWLNNPRDNRIPSEVEMLPRGGCVRVRIRCRGHAHSYCVLLISTRCVKHAISGLFLHAIFGWVCIVVASISGLFLYATFAPFNLSYKMTRII